MDAMQSGPSAPSPRTIAFCADDYGLAPGIGEAIRDLARQRRLTATSCMVTGPHWPDEARRLRDEPLPLEVGLHLVLTGQQPLRHMARLAPGGRLPPVSRLLGLCLAGRVDRREIDEVERQLDRFEAAWDAPPAHLDGHHHVHQFPVVREIVIDLFARRLRGRTPLVRCCAQPVRGIVAAGVSVPRTLLIGWLGRAFARRASGLPMNAAFRGVRTFAEGKPYLTLLEAWLRDAPDGTLVMCHPGRVDEALTAVDDLTTPREEEFRVLAGPEFAALLDRLGLQLGRITAKA